jgi:hypothetical protein
VALKGKPISETTPYSDFIDESGFVLGVKTMANLL